MTEPPRPALEDAPPRRVIAPEDAPFWNAIDDGRFVLARCVCGAWYPRAQACVACHAGVDALSWVEASGRGEVRSFIVFDKPYHPWFATRLPYVVAVITLAEGPDIVTNVIDVDIDAVKIGMPVRVVIRERGGVNIHQASAAV